MAKRKAIEYENYLDIKRDSLSFIVDDLKTDEEKNRFEHIQSLLEKAGVKLELTPTEEGKRSKCNLTLQILPDKYIETQKRFAGAKVKNYKFQDYEVGLEGDSVHYSDVVLMLQTMTDQEIMEHIGIKYATYYRHKKKLLESEYYQRTDKNRLSDELYLKGEELNLYDNWF